jgi:hypothetical protein
LFVVETWRELREAVESGQCGIALIDAAVLGPRVATCVATLSTFHDRLVTLVAADRAAAHEYIGLLSGGRIHRLLIKPTAVGAARLLIESATARRLQLREEATKAAAPSAGSAAAKRPSWIWAAGIGAVALLAVAIVGSRLDWSSRAVTTETSAPRAAEATPLPVTAPTPKRRSSPIRSKAPLPRSIKYGAPIPRAAASRFSMRSSRVRSPRSRRRRKRRRKPSRPPRRPRRPSSTAC